MALSTQTIEHLKLIGETLFEFDLNTITKNWGKRKCIQRKSSIGNEYDCDAKEGRYKSESGLIEVQLREYVVSDILLQPRTIYSFRGHRIVQAFCNTQMGSAKKLPADQNADITLFSLHNTTLESSIKEVYKLILPQLDLISSMYNKKLLFLVGTGDNYIDIWPETTYANRLTNRPFKLETITGTNGIYTEIRQ